MGSQLLYEFHREFLVLEDVFRVLAMLLEHLLVVGLVNNCNDLLLVGLDVLPDLLQQEDILSQLLFLLLNAAQTCLLAAVQLLQILFNAELDGCLDLLVVLLERQLLVMVNPLDSFRSETLTAEFSQQFIQFLLFLRDVLQQTV